MWFFGAGEMAQQVKSLATNYDFNSWDPHGRLLVLCLPYVNQDTDTQIHTLLHTHTHTDMCEYTHRHADMCKHVDIYKKACTHACTQTTLKERCHSLCLPACRRTWGQALKQSDCLESVAGQKQRTACLEHVKGEAVVCGAVGLRWCLPRLQLFEAAWKTLKNKNKTHTILLLFPAVVYYGLVQMSEWCSMVLETSMLKFHCSLPICYFSYRALSYLVLQGCSTLSIILIFFLSFHIPV